MAKLCGFVVPGGALAYFFSGDLYWRFSLPANAVDPAGVADRRSLARLFDRDIDAVHERGRGGSGPDATKLTIRPRSDTARVG